MTRSGFTSILAAASLMDEQHNLLLNTIDTEQNPNEKKKVVRKPLKQIDPIIRIRENSKARERMRNRLENETAEEKELRQRKDRERKKRRQSESLLKKPGNKMRKTSDE